MMTDIKKIIFELNRNTLIIDIGTKCEITYQNISKEVDKKIIYNYVENLLLITDNWQSEYNDLTVIDGNMWKLSIHYMDHSTVYSGKALLPDNFDTFERLNSKLLEEAQYE